MMQSFAQRNKKALISISLLGLHSGCSAFNFNRMVLNFNLEKHLHNLSKHMNQK